MMNSLIVLMQAAPVPVQEGLRITDPPSGGVSPLAWIIICALVAAVTALGKVCVTLYTDLKKAREDLADAYEEQANLLRTLRLSLDASKPPTQFPPPKSGDQGGQS
jgi:hypothetical protein